MSSEPILSIFSAVVAFALVILAAKKKFSIGAAMISGALIIALFSMRIEDIPTVLMDGLSKPVNYKLILVVSLIPILGYCFQKTGEMAALADHMKILFPDKRLTLALIPAIFSMLPMPGGALFSAPIVDSEGNLAGISSSEKNFLNFWFRHIVFLISPLEPALVFTALISGINLYSLILIQIPIFLIAMFAGFWFSLRKIKQVKNPNNAKVEKMVHFKHFIVNFSPILVVPILNILFTISLEIAIVIGIFSSFIVGKVNLKKIPVLIKAGISKNMIVDIFGIVVFQSIIGSSGILDMIVKPINVFSFLTLTFTFLISFVIGLLTGNLIAPIAMIFPLFLPIAVKANVALLPVIAFLYVSAFLGQLISPAHLCLIVSTEYFKENLTRIYLKLVAPILLVVASTTAILAFSLF